MLIEKPVVSQLFKKYTAFHGTRKFIIMLTRDRHLSPVLGHYKPLHAIPTDFFKVYFNPFIAELTL